MQYVTIFSSSAPYGPSFGCHRLLGPLLCEPAWQRYCHLHLHQGLCSLSWHCLLGPLLCEPAWQRCCHLHLHQGQCSMTWHHLLDPLICEPDWQRCCNLHCHQGQFSMTRQFRDVNNNTSSSIIKLQYQIFSIAKQNKTFKNVKY